MKKEFRKVAIYARVSTRDKQDYQRQISDLIGIILEDGYSKEEIEIFAEKISGYGKADKRPELERLIQITDNQPQYFDCIYTTEISRVGRNPSEIRRIIDRWMDLRVPLFIQTIRQRTIDKDGERNFIISIILQVLMEMANTEAQQLKIRSKSGLRYSASIGRAGGSNNHPYGYTKDDDKMLVIEPTESEIIQKIFNFYKSGNGIKAIANILNETNVPTRTNKTHGGKTLNFSIPKSGDAVRWSDKQIHDIIRNTLYYGDRKFKGEIFKAPAIITKELFDECQEIRETKTHRNYLTEYTYLLKDLLTCGCCGRNYYAKYKPVKNGDKVYICSSRLAKGQGCGNMGVNISLIESAIFDQMIQSDTLSKYVSKGEEILNGLKNDVEQLEIQLKINKSALEKKNKEFNRLLDLHLQDKLIPHLFDSKSAEIESQKRILEDRINNVEKILKEKLRLTRRYKKDGNSSARVFYEAMNNRHELKAMFQQFIHNVTIKIINSTFILCELEIKLNGIVMSNKLQFVLNRKSVRQEELKYFAINVTSSSMQIDSDELIGRIEEYIQNEGWNIIKYELKVESTVHEQRDVA